MILSQRDKRWANDKLGNSNLTIGQDGCTATCLAMVNNDFGANCTPLDVAEHKDWFTPQGLILWYKLNLKFAVFQERVRSFKPQEISHALNDHNKRVMLELLLPRNTKHWVIAQANSGSSTYQIRDPWDGTLCSSTKYGPVVGYAIFNKRIPSHDIA